MVVCQTCWRKLGIPVKSLLLALNATTMRCHVVSKVQLALLFNSTTMTPGTWDPCLKLLYSTNPKQALFWAFCSTFSTPCASWMFPKVWQSPQVYIYGHDRSFVLHQSLASVLHTDVREIFQESTWDGPTLWKSNCCLMCSASGSLNRGDEYRIWRTSKK